MQARRGRRAKKKEARREGMSGTRSQGARRQGESEGGGDRREAQFGRGQAQFGRGRGSL